MNAGHITYLILYIIGMPIFLNDNIVVKYSEVCTKLSVRKMIHPNMTRTNVATIRAISLRFGKPLPTATVSLYFLRLLPINSPGTKRTALYAPHATNVQFAPCHSPEIRKTVNVFNIIRTFEHLLPPHRDIDIFPEP